MAGMLWSCRRSGLWLAPPRYRGASSNMMPRCTLTLHKKRCDAGGCFQFPRVIDSSCGLRGPARGAGSAPAARRRPAQRAPRRRVLNLARRRAIRDPRPVLLVASARSQRRWRRVAKCPDTNYGRRRAGTESPDFCRAPEAAGSPVGVRA